MSPWVAWRQAFSLFLQPANQNGIVSELELFIAAMGSNEANQPTRFRADGSFMADPTKPYPSADADD